MTWTESLQNPEQSENIQVFIRELSSHIVFGVFIEHISPDFTLSIVIL